MIVLLLVLLGQGQPYDVQWGHTGQGVTFWSLCVDDDCMDYPKGNAKTSEPGVWRLPKPKGLDDGRRHLVTIQACVRYKLKATGKTRDVCSKPDTMSYQRNP